MSSPSTIHPAIVQLYAARGRWQKANSLAPWAPDAVEHLSDGFSGDSQRFVWDRVWPENYWLAADDVGSGPNRGDRRSVIRLFDGHDDLVRRIELVAY